MGHSGSGSAAPQHGAPGPHEMRLFHTPRPRALELGATRRSECVGRGGISAPLQSQPAAGGWTSGPQGGNSLVTSTSLFRTGTVQLLEARGSGAPLCSSLVLSPHTRTPSLRVNN